MTEGRDRAVEVLDKAHERGSEVLAEMVAVASAGRVFGPPVVAGERTVITAAEVHTGLGFGHGLAAGDRGRGRRAADPETKAVVASWGPGRRRRSRRGPEGGGGGGGQATGRPVAIVTIDPTGVHVQPVVDRTKIALTAITALGAVGWMLLRSRRAGSTRS